MKKRVYKYHNLINFINTRVTVRPSIAARQLGINSGTVGSYLRYLYRAGLIEKTSDSHHAYTFYVKTKSWSRESAIDAIMCEHEKLAQKKKGDEHG